MMHFTRMMLFSLICSNSAHAVTINGQDINKVLQPNQVLVYDNTDSQSISLSADTQGNITITSMRLTPECERSVSSYYMQLELAQDRMAQKRGKQVCFKSASSQYYEGAYIEGAECIALSAGTSLAFSNSILRSGDVYLEAPSMAFVDTYLDADTLTLASTVPEAFIESISIFFERESGIAPLVIGAIDFKANEIMGSVQQGMAIVGVKKVVISFAHLAFYQEEQDSDDQDDEIEPACDQEAQEFQEDDEQRYQQADDISAVQPAESEMLVEEAADESDLLAEMAVQEREVQAMQEREAHAQEKQLLENTQEDSMRAVVSCPYAQELPMDNVSCELDTQVRCSACSAGKDEKNDVPAITKLQEQESLPEAKIHEAELSAPVYTPVMRTCCKSTECASFEEPQEELTAAKSQKRWLDVLTGPAGIVVGIVAAGVAGKYAYTHWFASTRTT